MSPAKKGASNVEKQKIRVGINGFGRIGRLVFRRAIEEEDIEVVAVNDLADPAINVHLLKHDTTHGKCPINVELQGHCLLVEGRPPVEALVVRDITDLPWKELGVDIVVESTGAFTQRADLEKHLEAGAEQVILTAPAKTARDVDLTVVLGVNEWKYSPLKLKHRLISNASCTTNCLAPVAKVLQEKFGIVKGLMSTVHSITNDQRILDIGHQDLRRARAANENIIPSTTGAAKAIGLVLPELEGKLNGGCWRVPVKDVSVLELVALLKRETSVEEVNQVLKDAASKARFQSLAYTDEPLVSCDYIHNSYSSVVDAGLTAVMGNMVKVVAWYDNEWAYSCRVVDLIKYLRGLVGFSIAHLEH